MLCLIFFANSGYGQIMHLPLHCEHVSICIKRGKDLKSLFGLCEGKVSSTRRVKRRLIHSLSLRFEIFLIILPVNLTPIYLRWSSCNCKNCWFFEDFYYWTVYLTFLPIEPNPTHIIPTTQ